MDRIGNQETSLNLTSERPNADSTAVRVERLQYRYGDGREVLRGVDLEIGAGETLALVGPNGAGKSTFLLHLNGILPGRQPAGDRDGGIDNHSHGLQLLRRPDPIRPSIWIDGIPVIDRNLAEIRRRVGLLFQDPDDQLFCPTVLDDVAFGPLNRGLSKEVARQQAMDALARVDLTELADRPPHHLSFGERKRACLAGILACQPTLLVLDEPTANLDPRARRGFMKMIRSLRASKLIATHDLEMVIELCDRVALLDGGRVVAEGSPKSLLADESLMEAHGLELPLSIQLRREQN